MHISRHMDNHTTESTESTDPLEVPYEPSDAPSAEVEEKEGVDSGSSDDDEANEPIESAPPKPTLCPEELENLVAAAEALKLEGNALYSDSKHEEAILKYTDAIKTLERGDETNVALAAYYSNRAASYTALHQWENVERDSSAALKIKPDYLKTLVRRAQAYEQLDKPDKALDDWKKVLELQSDFVPAKQALQRLPPIIAAKQEKEREEMMGQLKDLGNKFLGLFGLSVDNFKAEKDASGGYKLNFSK